MLTVLNSSHDPFYNQAFEEYVFEHFREGEIFLLWQNDPAVIVGSYQNICREVHVERLRQLGIPVIRRITGGGTVYHDLGNLNYTYISDGGAAIDYDQCLGPILAALNDIGVPARKNRTCDIAIGGGKISGSAQRMTKGRLLHHGTLLFSSDLGVLDQITTHRKNDCFQSKGTQSAICTVTNIREHLARPMTIEEFRERLLDRMVPRQSPADADGGTGGGGLPPADEKYRSWEWTWGKTRPLPMKSPACSQGAHPGGLSGQTRHYIRCNGRLSPAGRRPGCRTAGGRTADLSAFPRSVPGWPRIGLMN